MPVVIKDAGRSEDDAESGGKGARSVGADSLIPCQFFHPTAREHIFGREGEAVANGRPVNIWKLPSTVLSTFTIFFVWIGVEWLHAVARRWKGVAGSMDPFNITTRFWSLCSL